MSFLKPFINQVFWFFVSLGGFGLLFLGIMDSSFLFMPLGNDLLVIGMTARRHGLMPYYAAMATAGSVLGCLLVDLAVRKGGEKGLEKHLPPKRLDYIRNKVKKSAGWALAFAALMPPPFPFTPFVIASAALDYPRRRLLAVIGASRFVRFTVEGCLAIVFGKQILGWAQSPVLWDAVLALIVISIAGSVFSIIHWFKRSKKTTQPENRAVR